MSDVTPGNYKTSCTHVICIGEEVGKFTDALIFNVVELLLQNKLRNIYELCPIMGYSYYIWGDVMEI